MKDVRIDGVAKPVEIEVLRDWAWLRNHLTITMMAQGDDKSGQPSRRAGCTLTILNRKPDGAWVITRDANLLG